jgi:hypothetical protein
VFGDLKHQLVALHKREVGRQLLVARDADLVVVLVAVAYDKVAAVPERVLPELVEFEDGGEAALVNQLHLKRHRSTR